MPYNITNSRGQLITTVANGTINTGSTDLTLIGHNYAFYGEPQNENFVYLLENFAKDTAPLHPIPGQLWFNTATNSLSIYSTESSWVNVATGEGGYGATGATGPQGAQGATGLTGATGSGGAGGVTVSNTPPLSPSNGQLWYDSSTNFRLFFWSSASGAWVDASPATNDSVAAVTVSATPPASPYDGELWYDSGTKFRLFFWSESSAAWVDASPAAFASVGATGATGPQGATGSQGPQGATGSQGPQGATGVGAQGATGPEGATGPQGATGAAGTNGADGATGPTGPTGSTGPQGATGTGGVGIGQTWQNLTSSRAAGNTYTNSTGQPIMVNIHYAEFTDNTWDMQLTVGGVLVARDAGGRVAQGTNGGGTCSAIVPSGATYSFIGPFDVWAELR